MFVDGLDEYQGDHSAIAKLFIEVTNSNHVKVCVSSRPLAPLLVFDKAFRNFPGLSLQILHSTTSAYTCTIGWATTKELKN
jgi:hypothetical protein